MIYIHPGGNRDRRFKRFHLWNSVGQAFEEAMAMSSLMYDGVLERHPKLKICVSHGGGYMPYYMGRIDRNYVEKANTRVNMTKPPIDYLRMLYFDSCVYDRAGARPTGREGGRRSRRARLGLSGRRDEAGRVRARHRRDLEGAARPDHLDERRDAAWATELGQELQMTDRPTIFSRVPDAVQREARRNGAPLIRGRNKH